MDNLEKLTDGELDKRLSEAFGNRPEHNWVPSTLTGKTDLMCVWCRRAWSAAIADTLCEGVNPNIPKYCADLNQCFSAQERVCEKVGNKEYGYHLRQIVCPDLALPNGIMLAGATAPARQRVIAMLRALGENDENV